MYALVSFLPEDIPTLTNVYTYVYISRDSPASDRLWSCLSCFGRQICHPKGSAIPKVLPSQRFLMVPNLRHTWSQILSMNWLWNPYTIIFGSWNPQGFISASLKQLGNPWMQAAFRLAYGTSSCLGMWATMLVTLQRPLEVHECSLGFKANIKERASRLRGSHRPACVIRGQQGLLGAYQGFSGSLSPPSIKLLRRGSLERSKDRNMLVDDLQNQNHFRDSTLEHDIRSPKPFGG